jgi:predicted nucleic acid-binding protein
MKIVVSNTSPIRYLVDIGEQQLLPQLFGKILIPRAVFRELTERHTPNVVREFIKSVPIWLEVCDAPPIWNSSLDFLDDGEREAIVLAEQRDADLLLIDEKKGRLIAQDHGLKITGVLGILELADIQCHIDLPRALEKLLQTNMNVSASLIEHILHRHYQRHNS